MTSAQSMKMEKKSMEPNEFFDQLTYDLAKSYEAEAKKEAPEPARRTPETKDRP